MDVPASNVVESNEQGAPVVGSLVPIKQEVVDVPEDVPNSDGPSSAKKPKVRYSFKFLHFCPKSSKKSFLF